MLNFFTLFHYKFTKFFLFYSFHSFALPIIPVCLCVVRRGKAVRFFNNNNFLLNQKYMNKSLATYFEGDLVPPPPPLVVSEILIKLGITFKILVVFYILFLNQTWWFQAAERRCTNYINYPLSYWKSRVCLWLNYIYIHIINKSFFFFLSA